MKVLVKQNPRTIALVSDSHALLFRQMDKTKVAVEIAPNELINTKDYRRLIEKQCYGFLGLISIGKNIFIAVITGSAEAAKPLPSESISRIYSVDFLCVTRKDWDFVSLDSNGFPIVSPDIDYRQQRQSESQLAAHPCHELKALLESKSFYYSSNFDVTTSLQNRGVKKHSLSYDNYSEDFMWNCFMMKEMVRFRDTLDDITKEILDSNGFLTTVIRGFAETFQSRFNGFRSSVTVISKQSWKRAGTRFNARGIDDEGYVANFVETEFIINCEKVIYSYTQIRGSVPIFWEQTPTIINPKVTVTRALEATQPVFDTHFQSLREKYGPVHVVNLLSATKSSEIELSKRYRNNSQRLPERISFTDFDFHQQTGNNFANAVKILPSLQSSLEDFGYYSYDVTNEKVLSKQSGVFRTNCLDCLDRTNLVQQVISTAALELFMEDNQIRPAYEQEIMTKHNLLWADHGDAISQIYTGTNALKSSFSRTGKMSLAGALSDMTKSVSRIYVNNFVDQDKQISIDTLLGRIAGDRTVQLYDPISDFVTAKLAEVEPRFTTYESATIFTGSFNVNAASKAGDLSEWLFPPHNEESPNVYVIGLQEIVELNAGNILNSDSTKAKYWQATIDNQLNQEEKYLLLRSETIASMMVLLFVKASKITKITQVAGSSKKTGMGGMTANKGACAVRFNYGDSSFVMITSHLAAGNGAVVERYNDYQAIINGLKFPRNLQIKDHENIIWFGDLNYRVTLPNDQARFLVDRSAYDDLLQYDQLNNEIIKGGAFKEFKEGVIKFAPTYKFDRGTSNYDTSEKQRTPSWTDRVLYIGKGLKQLNYFSVMNCYVSDHKPVYATFDSKIKLVDKELKHKLSKNLYLKYKESQDGNQISLFDINTDESSTINSGKSISRSSTQSSNFNEFEKPPLPNRPTSVKQPMPSAGLPKRAPAPLPPISRKTSNAQLPPKLPIRASGTLSRTSNEYSEPDYISQSKSVAPEPKVNVAPIAPAPRKKDNAQVIPIGFSSTPLLPSNKRSPSTSTDSNRSSPAPVRPSSTPVERPDMHSEILVPTKVNKVGPMIPKKPAYLHTSKSSTQEDNDEVDNPNENSNSDEAESKDIKHAPTPLPVRKNPTVDMSLANWKPLTPK